MRPNTIKIIRNISIGLILLAMAIMLASFILPRQVHVERPLVINAHSDAVFHQINTVKDRENQQ